MSKYEAQIQEIVSLRGTISVLDLARELKVSDQTIRRVVRPLVECGEIRKVHGALVSNRSALDPPFLARMTQNRAAKVQIARAVAALVKDGDSIAIDTGSTSAFAAQALRERKDLTVVTNSAFVASTLAMIPGNNVSMAGTQLRDHDGAAFDRSAFDVIGRMQVDYVLLSASLVDAKRGFLVHEQCEVDIASAMMDISAHTIMAVDSSKFEPQSKRPALRQPALREGDFILTDRAFDPAFDPLFEQQTVLIAENAVHKPA
ncbi:DeoR/GlpR family DNA-binding transcription regulator [Oricola sp.]|uniref:DeoR/GlpR family DNA-binding transcription regulator n=1 Tax=Oricola sp. TaxID=1979950 RepID=UPI003BAD3E3D